MSAPGNQGGNNGLGVTPVQSFQMGLMACEILGVTAAAFGRVPGSPGAKYWRRLPAFLGLLVPLLVVQANPARTPLERLAGYAFCGAVLLLVVGSSNKAQANIGVQHDYYCGRTRGRKDADGGRELLIALVIALPLLLVSEPLAKLMAVSGFCNLLSLKALDVRRQLQARAAFNAQIEAGAFADDLRDLKGGR